MADLIVEIGGDVKKLNNALSQANKQVSTFANTTERENQKIQKSFGALNSFATGALAGIAAGFSVGAVVNFGKAVLDTTAQFQKFGAVLSNTLGSNSEAQLALSQITKFASETPFAVDELTGAFVKLANQGFRPTIQELTALGDLAASTGKSFDQLAEAVLDAQVGEFERLKEFGVRAKVSGDNVTFTFKGVETQVKKTDEAIRGYILSLGEAEGVSGAMAKISETVGGKISNLGDNVTQLRLAIGNQSEGVFAASIDWLNTFAQQATLVIKGLREIKQEVKETNFGDAIQETRKEIDQLTQSFLRINPALTQQEAIQKAVDAVTESYRKLSSTQLANGNLTIGQLQQTIVEIEKYGNGLLKAAANADELKKIEAENEGKKQRLALLEEENKKIAALNQSYKTYIDQLLVVTDKDISDRLVKAVEFENRPLIKDLGNLAPETPPILEFADQLDEVAERAQITIGDLSAAFQGLGASIGRAFGVKPAFGQFLGALIPFAAKLIATNFKIAASSAVAGASNAAAATGPAAPFTLPAFIAGALGVVGAAFAAFGSGGGRGGFSGGGDSGISGGQASNFSGGASSSFDPNRNITLSGGFEISGDKLRYVLNQSDGFRN
jgi:hypothetical protein